MAENTGGASYKTGTVVETRPGAVRVEFADLDGLRSDWLPVAQKQTLGNRSVHTLKIGSQVSAVMDGSFEAGTVLGAIYSDPDPSPVDEESRDHTVYEDGAEIDYDTATHTLTVRGGVERVVIEAGQEIILKAGQRITLDAPDVVCTGNLQVQGMLSYENGLAGRGGRAGAAAVIHGDVQVKGQLALEGDMQATGSIMDAGGNSNHHSHGN